LVASLTVAESCTGPPVEGSVEGVAVNELMVGGASAATVTTTGKDLTFFEPLPTVVRSRV
jgi:hypothetical protein